MPLRMVRELLAIFLQGSDAGVEPFAHAVEGADQLADLGVALGVDALAAGAVADFVGDADEVADRPAQPPGQPGAEDQTAEHRGDRRAADQDHAAQPHLGVPRSQGDDQRQSGEDHQVARERTRRTSGET